MYDVVAAMQFNLLTFLGLREHHYLLDVGCGSLRGGRLFIPYLLTGRYFGIEPNRRLIKDGIQSELGEGIIPVKRPVFSHDENFTLSIFDKKFDFILAHSIFSHTSQYQIRRCLSEAKKVMTPTSIFAATFLRGEKNYTGDEWSHPNRAEYTLEHMISLVEQHGLTLKVISWPHHRYQTWVLIVNPEHEKNLPDLERISQAFSNSQTLRLKEELELSDKKLRLSREELSQIQKHPYVRFGFKIRRLVRRIARYSA